VQTDAGPLKTTMSLGLLLSSDWHYGPANELLREVDAALYAAKAAGRNLVSIAKAQESREMIVPPQPIAEHSR
jgi:GGDEF domain-containing protein